MWVFVLEGEKGGFSKRCQFHSKAPCVTFTRTHTFLSSLPCDLLAQEVCSKYWIWFLLFLVLRLIIYAVFLPFEMKNWSTRVRESQATVWEHDYTLTNMKRLNTHTHTHTHTHTLSIQYRPIYCMYASTYAMPHISYCACETAHYR